MEYLFQTQRVSIINIPKAIRNTCYKIIKKLEAQSAPRQLN